VVWPYVRFTLCYRDVKDLLAERGWTSRMRPFGDGSRPLFARELARGGLRPPSLWHLDEMTVIIAGEQFFGRAVHHAATFSICSCNDAATRPQPRG
jgi:transposase-like protein